MNRRLFLSLTGLSVAASVVSTLVGRSFRDGGEGRGVHSDDDYSRHVAKLKRKLPSNKFHVLIQKPFVVVGDEDAATVKSRAIQTVKWSVDRLKRQYFSRNPDHIIDIWLFKDKNSYEKHAEQLFGSRPTTPYGYYSSQNRALVMNIRTGGGTLVHEIVHPFIAANFSKCPSWFNEGLASLYEQCRDHDGRIWGSTNWRLRGLQEAIAAKTIPLFKKLCGTTTDEFYNADRGTNYAQARYLCLYLQERELLEQFYHQFVRGVDDDPGGYKTLQKILQEDDMADFQRKWEDYVLKLRF